MHRRPLVTLSVVSGTLSVVLFSAVPAPWGSAVDRVVLPETPARGTTPAGKTPDAGATPPESAPAVPTSPLCTARDLADETAVLRRRGDVGPPDPYEVGRALRALALQSPAEAVPRIASGLADPDERVRFFALEAALRAADASLVPLLRPLALSADGREARLALGALSRAGEAHAADQLRRVVETHRGDGDVWAEALAAECLVVAEAPGAPGLWLRALAGMHALDRAMAVERFRDGAPEPLHEALRGLLSDRDADVRAAAAAALGEPGRTTSR